MGDYSRKKRISHLKKGSSPNPARERRGLLKVREEGRQLPFKGKKKKGGTNYDVGKKNRSSYISAKTREERVGGIWGEKGRGFEAVCWGERKTAITCRQGKKGIRFVSEKKGPTDVQKRGRPTVPTGGGGKKKKKKEWCRPKPKKKVLTSRSRAVGNVRNAKCPKKEKGKEGPVPGRRTGCVYGGRKRDPSLSKKEKAKRPCKRRRKGTG